MNVSKTEWARTIKKTHSPEEYKTSLKYAKDTRNIFSIQKTTTHGMWGILHGEFIMCYAIDEESAIKLCNDMGWQYVVIEQ